jgi:hypothetical protein
MHLYRKKEKSNTLHSLFISVCQKPQRYSCKLSNISNKAYKDCTLLLDYLFLVKDQFNEVEVTSFQIITFSHTVIVY